MQDLNVTLIQTELHWEDKSANLAMFDAHLERVAEETHVILLPEMFTTGFTMNAGPLAEDMSGATVAWIRAKAAQMQVHIAGSAIIRENGRFHNRLLWAQPGGEVLIYDKRHLFRMAGEEKVYAGGTQRLFVEVHGWRICPFVCYDLRFPVWLRNVPPLYDVAVFVANWPAKRAHPWRALLVARAIENQCYVVGVNRVGKDGNGFYYSGDSMIIDPHGEVLFHRSDEVCIHTHRLDRRALEQFRERFPAWRDADAFRIVGK